jgi:hypothetical protein
MDSIIEFDDEDSSPSLENNYETLKNRHIFYQDQGDILLIEDCTWSGTFFTAKNLKDLMQTYDMDTKLVVILTCHSELIGKIFHEAGAEHVICIKKRCEIDGKLQFTSFNGLILSLDAFWIEFTKDFYKILFEQNNIAVCDAYKRALGIVKTKINKNPNMNGEETKFMILNNHAESKVLIA